MSNPVPGPVLAIDVGGTKLAAAVVTPDGTIRDRAVVPTPATDDPDKVGGALVALAHQVAAAGPASALRGIGVGSAGPLDPYAGTVSPVNIVAWRGYRILDALRDVLPGRPAYLGGDGQCMALGEYRWGGYTSAAFLGIVVSTGVGGGLVLDGRVYQGPTGNAGHIGHIPVSLDGPDCPCGGRGCVEVLGSGTSIVRWARANGWETTHPTVDAIALAADARAGHPVALEAFHRSGNAVGAGIVATAGLFDLDDVVIGGGVANVGDLLFDPIRAAISSLAGLDYIKRVRVHRSTLGGDAGLLGAAALVMSHL
ncbi:glucokinase [Catenuloplanes nepalensis]|uniref:Glucokinase n=1 Tax=Catenuloplanes nepalensis TaxID=587533 RepID=A0ABT9N0Q2_9ACTN|nr:ROK family protein [Catenuloplanes nepalensis]MDP9797274.1 glucokinase [Catenuloplanes nepalensis]